MADKPLIDAETVKRLLVKPLPEYVRKKPVPPEVALERAIRGVVMAWEKEGVNPAYHREQKKKLARHWHSLYNALESLSNAYRG
jgi:hypothetical protein